jgi:acyl-CoA reductase-like NAD-dependent aldehyde dehydrogenase
MSGSSSSPAPDSELGTADQQALDQALTELAAGARRWAATPLPERAALLRRVQGSVAAQADLWVRTAATIKGLEPTSRFLGEEWLSGPYAVLASLARLATTIDQLAGGTSPLESVRTGTAPGGRVTLEVAPLTAYDRLLLHGFRAEVWLPPGVTPEQARARAGLGQLDPTAAGGVGLVLGAGNITSIAPLDVLYELVAANRPVLLKLNPVMAEMQHVYDAAFAPLVSSGLLRIVSGGAVVGDYLAHHPGVAHVHLTGSATTYDAVRYGPGQEGRTRKSAGVALLDKPITSELGGVSPIIIVPSHWTKRDLRYQAEHVATQRLHNGGYNCVASQVVVLSSDWPQKEEFLSALREVLQQVPGRTAWYPGSAERTEGALAAYPQAERLGPDRTRVLVELPANAPSSADEPSSRLRPVQTTEYFAPVLGVVELPGAGQQFLDSAVETVNRDFYGTLGANVLVDPEVMTALGDGFGRALAALEYGTIAVNCWTAFGFLAATAPWGAFPQDAAAEVTSGVGAVHNALLIEAPERTVVHGPFRPFPRSVLHGEWALSPKPPWFVTARSAATTGRLLARFTAAPSWLKVPRIFGSAFRA